MYIEPECIMFRILYNILITYCHYLYYFKIHRYDVYIYNLYIYIFAQNNQHRYSPTDEKENVIYIIVEAKTNGFL